MILTSGRFCISDMVVELAPLLPATVAELFSPSLIFAWGLFTTNQTETALYYDVLVGVGQKEFAVGSIFVELPWT